MKRRRGWPRAGAALGMVLACLVFTLAASASISGASGQVALIPPPPSVLFGHIKSDKTAFAFDEQQCVPLASSLKVDISSPGTYHLASDLRPATLPRGTVVSSHFLDAERATERDGKYKEYKGEVRFDAPVIGIEVGDRGLDQSDSLGAPGTLYPTGMKFRKENLIGKQLDTVSLASDRHTVSFDLQVQFSTDQFRVITACGDSPPPTMTIAVRVVTQPAGDPTKFSFGGDVSGSTGDGGSLSAQVPAGEYTSSETVPAGWTLASISCDDGGSGNVGTGKATFSIVSGKSVSCTFTDTKNREGSGSPGNGSQGGGDGGGGGGGGGGGASPQSTVKIALVTSMSAQTDLGLGRLAVGAIGRVEQSQGLTVSAADAKTSADYEPVLSSFADAGYGLVIAVGPALYGAVKSIAARFPQTDFVILGRAWSRGDPPNLQGVVFRVQEAGYLAGYLAGLVGGDNPATSSSIGGRDISLIDRFLAGYQAGVLAAAPKAQLLNAFSQDLTTQKTCRRIALEQIARGSKTIFEVAGRCGLGVVDAAVQKDIWAIGVNADHVGAHVLASAMERSDIAAMNALHQFQAGHFMGGTTVAYTIKNGGVGIARISAKVPKADLAKLATIKKNIATGKIIPPSKLR